MSGADLLPEIKSLIAQVNAKLGAVEHAAGNNLKSRATSAVADALQGIAKLEEGGMLNDIEAAGELTEAAAELAGVLSELAAVVA